jgi:hypothetical protein
MPIAHGAVKNGAGHGNRTHILSLEGWCLTNRPDPLEQGAVTIRICLTGVFARFRRHHAIPRHGCRGGNRTRDLQGMNLSSCRCSTLLQWFPLMDSNHYFNGQNVASCL